MEIKRAKIRDNFEIFLKFYHTAYFCNRFISRLYGMCTGRRNNNATDRRVYLAIKLVLQYADAFLVLSRSETIKLYFVRLLLHLPLRPITYRKTRQVLNLILAQLEIIIDKRNTLATIKQQFDVPVHLLSDMLLNIKRCCTLDKFMNSRGVYRIIYPGDPQTTILYEVHGQENLAQVRDYVNLLAVNTGLQQDVRVEHSKLGIMIME